MNFIKTFLITLATYIGLNAVFLAVSIFMSPTFPLSDIYFVISTLFSQIIVTPGAALLGVATLIFAFDLIGLIAVLWLIIPPLGAVIIGARLGDTAKISFLSWFLTCVISCVVYLVLLILDVSPLLIYLGVPMIILVIIGGVVNWICYGCFSYLLSKGGL